jgi:hypothetical protein
VLVLPAKPSNPRLSRSFQDWHVNYLAGNMAVALRRLALRNRNQCGIVDGLHKAVAKSVKHGTERADVLRRRHMLLSCCAESTIINKGSTGYRIRTIINRNCGIHKVAVGIEVAYAYLRYLAGAAGNRSRVTGNTG